MPERTLLDRLEQLVNVDIDGVETAFIESLSVKIHNQTSNQVIMCNAMLTEGNRELFTEVVNKYADDGWEAIFDRVSVRICKKNVDLISGRVLVQVSPRFIANTDATVQQCRRFAKIFEEEGIAKDRFAIKLPFTGANALAAAQVESEGIKTLATTVFVLEQAIGASQANCHLISPYYNEIASYKDPSLWPNVADPALLHPMSPRLIQMLESYAELYKKTGKEQPKMVIASHISVAEILAMAEIGCEHITVTIPNLKTLSETRDTLPQVQTAKPAHPYANHVTPARLKEISRLDPLAPEGWNGIWASTSTDYLANHAENLDKAIQADEAVVKRLSDAMDYFLAAEATAKSAIEQEISRIKNVSP